MEALSAPATANLLKAGPLLPPARRGRQARRRLSCRAAQALEASAKAAVDLGREGAQGRVTDTTWDHLVALLRKLLGYAEARGYGHQPVVELLFNGPLYMEYMAFLVVGRRALPTGQRARRPRPARRCRAAGVGSAGEIPAVGAPYPTGRHAAPCTPTAMAGRAAARAARRRACGSATKCNYLSCARLRIGAARAGSVAPLPPGWAGPRGRKRGGERA